ncbi:hypothetical protein [Bradyrhizobium sp. LA2.1]|uniref:hypothetical protein n=1 Tax=Bradyrhizobium sp. LA2.1 TaxID=3156376 RepID=UPI00339432F0
MFEMPGADASEAMLFCKKLRREEVLKILAGQPACMVAIEACASSDYWDREIARLGHEVRLMAPDCQQPFVKQNNDVAVVFRARDLLVLLRTQTINAIHSDLAESEMVAARGPILTNSCRRVRTMTTTALARPILLARGAVAIARRERWRCSTVSSPGARRRVPKRSG